MTELEFQTKEQLYQMCDPEYRAFQSALLPTVAEDRMIGIRVPVLRRYARQMLGDGRGMQYLAETTLPHETYDEDNLHAFLLEGITDFDACMTEVRRFLPYVNNWATCDMMAPPILGTQPERLYAAIREWLASEHEFTVRFGLVMLIRHFLKEQFSEEVFLLVSSLQHEGYYVKMAAAWLMAEALAQQWECTYAFLRTGRLLAWTRSKAIQKALESRKLTDAQKAKLRRLREEIRSE